MTGHRPSCKTCRWWDEAPCDWDGLCGLCRASPPVMDSNRNGVWPITSDKSWCGRHEAKPEPKSPVTCFLHPEIALGDAATVLFGRFLCAKCWLEWEDNPSGLRRKVVEKESADARS